ncbi:MAG: hypothetical protein HFJ44_01315 [Clostridia bacterium]|nr:hypothetical protein [Clostridia bacterium]
MKKQNKKKRKINKVYQNVSLAFILIFAIAIFLVVLELNAVIKKKNEIPPKAPIVLKNSNNINEENNNVQKIGEGKSFDTFVDKVYTENEILNFSVDKIREIRQYQIDKKNTSNLSIQKIVGSASSENVATRIATQSYNNASDQIVRSSKVVLETDYYYVVKVEWDYVDERTSKRHNQQVLVFKEFYYNINNKTLNMDDINKVKDVLDLKYYVETYSNTGKNIIQSFINKNGEKAEYVIYYFEVELGEEGKNSRLYLVSDKIQIDAEKGLIESINTEYLSNGIRI